MDNKIKNQPYCELAWKEKSSELFTRLPTLCSKTLQNSVPGKIKNHWQVSVPASAVSAQLPSSYRQVQLISYIYNYSSCVQTQ